jgi:hypothetical protein
VFRIFIASALVLLMTSAASVASGDDHFHKNHIALFLGGTVTDHGDSGFTIAGEYRRRVGSNIAIGVLGEFADLDHRAWIMGIPLVLFPYRGLVLLVMPGVEFADHHSNYLTRVGIGYEIPLGKFSLTPMVNVDFVDGDQHFVFGITIGRGF